MKSNKINDKSIKFPLIHNKVSYAIVSEKNAYKIRETMQKLI